MILRSYNKALFTGFLFFVSATRLFAQTAVPDSLPRTSNHLNMPAIVAGTQVLGYGISLIALDKIWYRDFPRSSFHFHNDLLDWYQQDKLGHMVSTYHLSRISASSFRWSGIDNTKSAWLGVASGWGFLAAIEVLDGFSTEWGASIPDVIANTLGAGIFLIQQLTWQEQRFSLKYSYSESGLAHYRPELLGGNLPQRMLKDYNAQTSWLSVNISSFIKQESPIPPWLNLAIGHGVYGMLGSRENPQFINGMVAPEMNRYRQWYLAPDIDFSKVMVNPPWLKAVFSTLNFIKMPSPALGYSIEHGFRFHWIFF